MTDNTVENVMNETMVTEEFPAIDAAPAAPTAGRRFGLVAVLVPWVLAVVATAAAVFFGLRWNEQRNVEARAESAEVAAVTVLDTLVNWDAADRGLDDTRDALVARATGDFEDQIPELLGGPVGADLEASGAYSEGEVTDVYVQSLEADRAEVFAVAEQTIATRDPERSSTLLRRAVLVLRPVDGEWKASVVSITDGIVPLGPVE